MKRTIFIVFIGLLAATAWRCTNSETTPADISAPTPPAPKHGTADLAVTWELMSNLIDEQPACRAVFELKNTGKEALGSTGWAIYFNQTPRKIKRVEGPANVEHLSGDLFRIAPKPGFSLAPGDSVRLTYDMSAWLIKESDAPTGLYLVLSDENGKEQAPLVVSDYAIRPFVRPEQINRHKNDAEPIPTPAFRFDQYERLEAIDEKWIPFAILPAPKSFALNEGHVRIDVGTHIRYQTGLEKEAAYLERMLEEVLKVDLEVVNSDQFATNAIVLKVVPNLVIGGKNKEAYAVRTKQNMIEIRGTDAAGVFYGIQSLLQLIPVEAYEQQAFQFDLPQFIITDAPRFGYRGIHLDVARNFQDKAAVKKLMDAMAFYKLNKLHLHLTDDEGWRLEIRQLPELTEVGGRRGHTQTEREYLHPAFGSGPFPGEAPGSGYFTQADFIEILKYATDRHIEVIPEINMPGHARAAIKAMEARFERLQAAGKTEAAEAFRLIDPADRSDFRSVQNYPDNVVCPCRESVFNFFEVVTDEIAAMYEKAGAPLTTIHTGGDEVPGGVWTQSPMCQKWLSEHPDYGSAEDLAYYFRSRLYDILSKKHLTMAGWEEVALKKTPAGNVPDPQFKGGKMVPWVWNNLWGQQDLGNRLANAGYPVVLCNVTNLYFDLAYDKDPREPGLYWGGFVNTRKALEFLPFDVLKSTTTDALGRPFNPAEDFKDMERLSPEGQKNILGIQGQLWSETIKTPEMLEYYYLPKMFGLAQRAWSEAPTWADIEDKARFQAEKDKSWNTFAHLLGKKELRRLDHIFGGFNYRIPPPGVKISNGKVYANAGFPGQVVRFERGEKDPTPTSPAWQAPLDLEGTIRFRAFNQVGRGSRVVEVRADNAH
ncbi:MAG: beta-N-acetylhexosaminidase [Bacteroidetes bacterium]|nr:MAG: beta-N-acetylhexosaminidase [Bacteroidota bacterium]